MVVVVSIFSIVRCMRKEEAAVRATCQEIAVMDIDLRTRPVADPSSTPMKRFPDQSTHVSQVLTEVSQIQHQPSPRSRVDCGGRGSAAWQMEWREESQRSAPFSEPVLGQGLQTKCLIAGWDKASKQNFYGCWHMRHRRLRFVLRRSNWSSNI
ncbi:hypothetical protein DAI22_10g062400 [Oryza sativa Japonica Group]|nr:hypothetical protein DAI22_10g062400 [Oryza sativa Japonica Group]